MFFNNSTHQNWPNNPDWYKKPPAEENYGPFSPENPLKILVMFHDGASAFQENHRLDPEYNHAYKVIGAFTDNADAKAIDFFKTHSIGQKKSRHEHEENAISCIVLDWTSFENPGTTLEEKRLAYFQKAADLIEENFSFDIIFFSGFLRVVPKKFIERFQGRILNVHPADLTILDPKTGKRHYAGQGRRAIQKTIDDGQEYIRSTVAFVECGDPDEGEIIALSKPCKIIPGEPAIQLQDRLKKIGDSDALNQALSKIVSGEVLIPQRKPVKQRELVA